MYAFPRTVPERRQIGLVVLAGQKSWFDSVRSIVFFCAGKLPFEVIISADFLRILEEVTLCNEEENVFPGSQVGIRLAGYDSQPFSG
jgi:hypothetical protein